MGLEAGQFISDLVSDWPTSFDKRREGDDHLRLIKTVLKNTFPNLNAAVNATPAKLNNLPANTQAIITELKKHIVPVRTVVMFSGLEAQIPAGWYLCNGQTVAGFGVVPDLRGRFVIGASPNYALGSAGGSASVQSGAAGAHTHTVQGVAISTAQMPQHSHRVWAQDSGGAGDTEALSSSNAAIAGNTDGGKAYRATNGTATTKLIEDTGGGQPHTHGMDSAGQHDHSVATVPPYYALAFIIKTTDYVEPV